MEGITDTPPPADDFAVYHGLHGNPVTFMMAFWGMSRRRDRYALGFDAQSLEWISRVWDLAMQATGNHRCKQACEHERDRYTKLAGDLRKGEYERMDSGACHLNMAADWPKDEVIRGAIQALAKTQVTRIQ